VQTRKQIAEVSDRREVGDLSPRALRVGLDNGHQPAKSEVARRPQDARAVVDEEGALDVEGLDRLHQRPEARRLLGDLQVMRADDPVEVSAETGPRELECERLLMGVGDQDAALAAPLERLQKVEHMRMDRDQMLDLLLEQGDIQAELAAPMVDAVPLEGALDVAIAGEQLGLGDLGRKPAGLGVALGDMLEPKMIVEVQVEQGAVHIQEDGVDTMPIDHAMPLVASCFQRRFAAT
jgi:hypothetical protein